MKTETLTLIQTVISADQTATDAQLKAVLSACRQPSSNKRLGTVRQAAMIMECHPRTIQRYVRMGLLNQIRITQRKIRYDLCQVERLATEGVVKNQEVNQERI